MNTNSFPKSFECKCGKRHNSLIDDYIIEKGAINKVAECVKRYNAKKAFIIADINTYGVAGKQMTDNLRHNNIEFSEYVFQNEALEPDEQAVGSAVMHYDNSCDIVVGIGSGVINDISKMVSAMACVPYIIVATAPSMDGYASATSSMSMDGLKISLPSKCANVIIGDIDILKNAPERMLKSGFGDMIAKYISICEWRISNVITGEYYCEVVADYIRNAIKKCVDNAENFLKRDEEGVKAVFEGLVIGGVAMNYAGLLRPASGVEHYFSHIWDMRGLEFGLKVDFHGLQCAVAALYAAKIYDKLREYAPDREKALNYAKSFDYEAYKEKLRAFLGRGAEMMIALEEKEQKYNTQKQSERLDIIINNWDRSLEIIDEEVPSSSEIEKLLDTINAPKTASSIGIDPKLLPMTFEASKDVRDKYVLSRLCWDLGIMEECSCLLDDVLIEKVVGTESDMTETVMSNLKDKRLFLLDMDGTQYILIMTCLTEHLVCWST